MADDIKCFPAALEYLERGRNILGPPNFKFGRFKAKRAGCSPSVTHLNHRGGVSDIGHDRQPAKTGKDLRKSSTRLPASSTCWTDRPVMLPPGRLRLVTMPLPTASDTKKTFGITEVTCFAARTASVATVTMTSTLSWTNSAAISAARSVRPSVQRYSIAIVRPSIQPS